MNFGEWDPTTNSITVGASMSLYELAVKKLQPAGVSMPTMAFPYHALLTVGGVFSVAAHGASMQSPGHLVRGRGRWGVVVGG
jgi:hypothetical protein